MVIINEFGYDIKVRSLKNCMLCSEDTRKIYNIKIYRMIKMINKFGKVMIYVRNPKAAADFWIDVIGFIKLKVDIHETDILSVELTPNEKSDTSIVLFDRNIVEKMSPEINLGTPSILFSSYDITAMRNRLLKNGVNVGEIMEMGDRRTFNFSDLEGNYFAVQEIKRI